MKKRSKIENIKNSIFFIKRKEKSKYITKKQEKNWIICANLLDTNKKI